MEYYKEGINSGWVHDNRGGIAKSTLDTTSTVGDVSEIYGSALIREFNYFDTGVLDLEIDFRTRDDGAYLEYRDVDGNAVYTLKIVNGKWSILKADGTYVSVADTTVDGEMLLRAEINLNTGKSKTILNGKDCGTYDLLSDNILSFAIGIDEKGTGALTLGTVNMVVNYAVYDNFDNFGLDEVYGWTEVVNTAITKSAGQADMTANSKISKKFEKIDGGFIFETYFISKNGQDFTIKLGDGLTLSTKSKKLSANGTELYDVTQNMWYRLRVEGNAAQGKAEILLNGRTIGNVDLTSKNAIDTLTYESVGYLGVDNIKVYAYEKPEDYVAAPTTKASLDDYIVAMNICSLWRNGTHFGWACITPFDERKPVLGYYDEGVPETADWEIKYMVEHGIDVQAFCWFHEVKTGPIKTPRNSEQLHNGYMYAEYSDYMYYTLLWEAQNSSGIDSTQFRTNVVPYWFENYFLDERYLKIDNKLVLSVFGYGKLATSDYFKNGKGVKAEFDYLESKAKEYGFDGVIFLCSGSETANDRYSAYGFDGAAAYGWGSDGKKYSTTVAKNTTGAKATQVYQVPTVSVGYDTYAWHSPRVGMATIEDFGKGLAWIKDTYLPTYSSKADWADRFVWLSTWNEYGEGTYIMPAGDRGFGYADQVRKYMTNLPEAHTDVVPTLHQAERINHLYPQYATLARSEGWYNYNKTSTQTRAELKNKLYINDVDVQSNAENRLIIPPIESEGRILFGYSGATAIDHLLGAYSEWRRDVGTLKISAHGHELMFEAGSNLYVKDGELCELGYTVPLFDGLMMLDFTKLAEDLEYSVATRAGNIYITTDTYDDVWNVSYTSETGNWQFDQSFNDEGWVADNMNLITNKGTMTIVTISGDSDGNDGRMHWMKDNIPVDFLTERFSSVEIRVRYNYTPVSATNTSSKIYFTTDVDSKWNEAKALVFNHESTDSEGEWRTYTVDLTQDVDWQAAANITGLRFDPFDGQGTFEIDYIKFNTTPGYVYVPAEEKPAEVKNGDAEAEYNVHTSHNATITRVVDPDNKNNHIWYVESTEKNGAYTYFNSETNFKDYTKYKVEYRIKLVSNDKGTETPSQTTFRTNLKYTDSTGEYNHLLRNGVDAISLDSGWVEYEGLWTTEKIISRKNAMFSVYVDPKEGQGFSYYLDDIKITEIGSAKTQFTEFDWETLVGKSLISSAKLSDFTFEQCSASLEDGKLIITADEGAKDVKFTPNNVSFKADEYIGIAIKMKATGVDEEKDYFDIYFATEDDPNLSESKKINVKYEKTEMEADGYLTFLFDFATKQPASWTGKITQLRLDPSSQAGTYEIAEIILVKA